MALDEGRVPAVRPAHRQVAVGRVLREGRRRTQYNAAWWELRAQVPGRRAARCRAAEDDFDPGAKYHVASNTPYMRYFLARIYQFQFHRALCKAPGFTGPLHQCSIYGNKSRGERYRRCSPSGRASRGKTRSRASRGERELDASAILEYFAPLRAWLEDQNKGEKCGW